MIKEEQMFNQFSFFLFVHNAGPFKVNGVPLRRVNQAYVIATETKVDISGVNVSENINDAYFKKPTQSKKSSKFFAEGEKVLHSIIFISQS